MEVFSNDGLFQWLEPWSNIYIYIKNANAIIVSKYIIKQSVKLYVHLLLVPL